MVKAPTTRHGKGGREARTIDLEAVRIEDSARAAEPYEGSPSGSATVLDDEVSPKAGHDAAMTGDETKVFEAEPVQTRPEGEGADPVIEHEPIVSETPFEAVAAEPETPPEGDKYNAATEPAASRPYISQPSPATVREQASRAGSGFGALLAAALLGGAIAIIGAFLLGRYGILSDQRESVDPAAFTQLQGEVEALRARDPSGEAEGQIAALRQNVEALTGQVTALEGRPQAQAVDLGPVESRLQALQQTVDAFGQRVDGLNQEIEEQANDPRLTLALSVSALKAAIDRGEPFAAELDTYAAAAEDEASIQPLRPLAAAGVPTRTAILAELPTAATAMVAAGRPTDADAGLLSRLWTSATGLVDVRPVGADVQGSAPDAIVARLEAAVRADDYAGAIREFEALPETVRAAGNDFMAKVRAREAADRLIDDALGQALNPA